MTDINLLPWREQRREQKRRQFYLMLTASMLVAVLFVAMVHLVIAAMISAQNTANNLLTAEIQELDRKILEIQVLQKVKSVLLERMTIIENLQANRPQIVHVFDVLVKVLPPGVYYTQIARKDREISIEGKADSNSNISLLMRNIDKSYWLTEPQLNRIQTEDEQGRRLNTFGMLARMVGPQLMTSQEKS